MVAHVLEDADQAPVVNLAVLVFDGFPGTELFQHIVHACQGQLGVGCLLARAMGVQLFTQGAEVGAQIVTEVGEGEFVETFCMVVIWAILWG